MQILWQFQCQKEGDIFYYQHGDAKVARDVVTQCPVCGSHRVDFTGRTFAPVDETAPLESFQRERCVSR